MPKVSVIIPTYNVEPYLVECMESITRQTLKDIEIICINDGSTAVSYTHLRAHETRHDLVCRLLLEKKKKSYTHLRAHETT